MWSKPLRAGLTVAGSLVFLAACQSIPTPPFPTEAPTIVMPTFPPSPSATATTQPTAPPATPSDTPIAGASLDCSSCHAAQVTLWASGAHANTQADVAKELSSERAGQSPTDVIKGQDAEDCIACHAATSVLIKGGMSEAQALAYFYTTEAGKFGPDTTPAHTGAWPHVSCMDCHDVPSDHPASNASLAFFNSTTGQTEAVANSGQLCGQCHGNLLFPGTDHQTYNAWLTSRHSQTQTDVADELSTERAGQTPADVIQGQDAENCIACHAPTAVLANGGMTEVQAIGYFFTTDSAGQFNATTAAANTPQWPSVSCTACHDPHNPAKPVYFDPATKTYQPMASADQLCGQCHGNLKFPDTDHLSYNILSGTGGEGVPDQKTMPGATCTSCHMYSSDVDGSNSAMYHGHSGAINVKEADGATTSSCTQCHSDMNAAHAEANIKKWQSEFASLEATVQENVAAAAKAIQGVHDTTQQAMLKEAQDNMTYAESDESGGFHNHKYLMALLQDANQKALEILKAQQ